MDFESQTIPDEIMEKRLDCLGHNFEIVKESVDIISASTDKIIELLDTQVSCIIDTLETDTQRVQHQPS